MFHNRYFKSNPIYYMLFWFPPLPGLRETGYLWRRNGERERAGILLPDSLVLFEINVDPPEDLPRTERTLCFP